MRFHMKAKRPVKYVRQIATKRSQIDDDSNHGEGNWNLRVRKDVSQNEADKRAAPIINPSTFMKYYLVH